MKRAVVVLLLLIANALVSFSRENPAERVRLRIKVAQVLAFARSLGHRADNCVRL